MLIPSQFILLETLILIILLGALFIHYGKWVAGIMVIPVIYFAGIYAFIDTFEMEDARLYVRYGIVALLTVGIIVAGRFLYILWRSSKNGHKLG